jgi:hypothetical protein
MVMTKRPALCRPARFFGLGLPILAPVFCLVVTCPAFGQERHIWTMPGTQGHRFSGAVWDASTRPASIIATDPVRRLVVRIALNGAETILAGRYGQPGFNGDQEEATQALLENPEGAVVDPNGVIDFVDGNRVRRITPKGALGTQGERFLGRRGGHGKGCLRLLAPAPACYAPRWPLAGSGVNSAPSTRSRPWPRGKGTMKAMKKVKAGSNAWLRSRQVRWISLG